ncbi:antibiotic biosynthesis monooxygenase [Streptomyces sp. NPDC047000]|uniref:putative quinol monooxygenase n=1 Tax=Streptomyces sp. NPDC047000 TaxID=3155474 RepID=UPI0033C7401E
MIIIHGGVVVDAARTDEVAAAGAAFQQACAAEEGCVEYQLSWRAGEPRNLRLLEIWTSRDAHNAHKEQAHTREWTEFVAGAAAAPPAFTEYEFTTP